MSDFLPILSASRVVSTYSCYCIYMFALPLQTSVLQTFYTHVNIIPRFLYEPVHSSVFVLQNVSSPWPSVNILPMFFHGPFQASAFVLQNVSGCWQSVSWTKLSLNNKLAHKLFDIHPLLIYGQTISQSPCTALTDCR